MKKDQMKIALLAILSCFLWATAAPVIKYELQYEPPLLLAGKRFVMAGIILMLLFGNIKQYKDLVIKNYKRILFLGILSTFASGALINVSTTLLPASIVSILNGSQPVTTALVSHFFGVNDKINTIKISSFLLGFIGILVISFPDKTMSYSLIGIMLLIVMNIFQGFANVYVAKDKTDISSMVLTSGQVFSGGILLWIASIFTEKNDDIVYAVKDVGYYVFLIWLSLVSSAAINIWFYLIKEKKATVSKLNVWKFLIPLFGVIISWMFLNEVIDTRIIIGMSIIVISIMMLSLSNIKINGK